MCVPEYQNLEPLLKKISSVIYLIVIKIVLKE